jgi:molybdopterin molybdotransferase
MNDTLNLIAPSCSDDHDPHALPPDIARERILTSITPLDADAIEWLPLLQSLDRVLAQDIIATMDVPPHTNSAMDGYALAGTTTLPATGIRTLRVIGSSFAGHPFLGTCRDDECVRIMTGGVLPVGCDTVIPQEHCETIDRDRIRIDNRCHPGDNVRAAGEDIRCGQTVLQAGRRMTAADLGLLASLGIAQVALTRRLRVAFFSTGDELRSIGTPLQQGEIYDSNRYSLWGMLLRQQCEVSDLGVIADEPTALHTILQAAAERHDVIISTGGASVGEADHILEVFNTLGALQFWKVAIKPGRPLLYGHIRQAVFFGLPGNPVAVMVCFYLFVLPALQRLSGAQPEPALTVQATTVSPLKKRAGRTEFQRGILRQAEDGSLTVRKTGEQGSAILLSMSRANCFIILNANQTRIEEGAMVTVQPFNGWL